MRHGHEEFFSYVIREIKSLPADQQHEALLQFTARILRSIDLATIARIRGEIESALGHTKEGQDILNLIDGHLALREIERE